MMENGVVMLLATILPFNKAFKQTASSGAEVDWNSLASKVAQPVFSPPMPGMPYQGQDEEEDYAAGREQIKEFLRHFTTMNYDAVAKCVKNSLEILKRRCILNDKLLVPVVGPPTDLDEVKARRAMAKAVENFIECDIILKIPEVELGPSLKALQASMDTVVNSVVMSTEGVALWGQEKTRIARHRLEDKFNVFKEDEFVE